MVYLHHTYLLVTPSASFGYFIRIFFTNNTVFFTESYGHFMQINRIFAIIQPPFQANRRLLKNGQESKSSLSTNKWQNKDLSLNIMIKAIINICAQNMMRGSYTSGIYQPYTWADREWLPCGDCSGLSIGRRCARRYMGGVYSILSGNKLKGCCFFLFPIYPYHTLFG